MLKVADILRHNKIWIRNYVEYLKGTDSIPIKDVLKISSELVRLQNSSRNLLENGLILGFKTTQFESKINGKKIHRHHKV